MSSSFSDLLSPPAPEPKVPFAASPLGVAFNTIIGLPSAALNVGRDIVQGIARSAGSAGLTIAKPLYKRRIR